MSISISPPLSTLFCLLCILTDSQAWSYAATDMHDTTPIKVPAVSIDTLNNVNNAYTHDYNHSLFWRNISHLPNWWSDNTLAYNFSLGWYQAHINHMKSALIKVPAFTTLLAIDKQHPNPTLSLDWSRGDGLFVPVKWHPQSDSTHKVIFNDSAHTAYLRIQWLPNDKVSETHYRPALFLSETDMTQWRDYREVVELPLPAYRIKRSPGSDNQKGYLLNPNEKISVTITGPTRLEIHPRLIYQDNQSDHWRQMTLHWQLNNDAELQFNQPTTMDYRYAYEIDDETVGLSPTHAFFIDVKPGIHTLHFRSEQLLMIDVYKLTENAHLLPKINAVTPVQKTKMMPVNHSNLLSKHGYQNVALFHNAACLMPPSLTIDHQLKQLWRRHARTLTLTHRFRDLYPDGHHAIQQKIYQTSTISSQWPNLHTTYLTNAQRVRQAQTRHKARFSQLSKDNPYIRYRLPPRQHDGRIRLLLPITEVDKQTINMSMDNAQPIIIKWIQEAVSPEAKQESLSNKARQQLGLSVNNVQKVAVAELPLPKEVKRIDITFSDNPQSDLSIALQYQVPKNSMISETDYIRLLSQQPHTLSAWIHHLQGKQAPLSPALATQWQPEIDRINTAAALFRQNIAAPKDQAFQQTIAENASKKRWQEAQQVATNNKVYALTLLQPLIQKSAKNWQRKAIIQRIHWLEALKATHLANQLRKQAILYSPDKKLRLALIAEEQQRLHAVSNWQGLFNLYAALLKAFPFSGHEESLDNVTLPKTCLKKDWLCLLAETRLRQGNPESAIQLFLLLPNHRQPSAWLVESAYKSQWQQTFSQFLTHLPKATQDFWHDYHQQHLGLEPPDQAFWPLPGFKSPKELPLQWSSLDKIAEQSSENIPLLTALDTTLHNSLMSPKHSITVTIEGPKLLRIGYRAIHTDKRLDERNDWLTLKDNETTLQAPLFNSQQLSSLTTVSKPLQVGVSQYLYYPVPAGKHKLQFSSTTKPWLIDLRLAQPPLSITQTLQTKPLTPSPVNLNQPHENRYQALINALWQVEKKGREATNYSSLLTFTPADLKKPYLERIALLKIIQRLQKNLAWQPLRYVNNSAGQEARTIKHWQPESILWQIQKLLSGEKHASNNVLLDHKSLLIDLYNLFSGDYRLVLQSYHSPASLFQPMQVALSDATQSKIIDINQPGKEYIPLELESGEQHLSIQNLTPKANQWLSIDLQYKNSQNQWQTLNQEKIRKYHLATTNQPVEISLKGPALLRIHSQVDDFEQSVRYQAIDMGWHTLSLTHNNNQGKQTSYRIFINQNKTDGTPPAPLLKPAVTAIIQPPSMASQPNAQPRATYSDWPPKPVKYQLPGSLHVNTGAFQRRLLEEDTNVAPEHFLALNLQYRFNNQYYQQYWQTDLLWRTARQAGKDTIGFKQRWDWLLPRTQVTLGAQVAFYWQGLEVPLTDMTEHDWAASGYFSSYIAKRQIISNQLTHTMKAKLFTRWFGLIDLPPALRSTVDQDIYSQYKNDHLYGLHLSERLNYSLWADARAYSTFSLSTNQDFNPFDADVYRLDLGWQQVFYQTSLEVAYRLQYFTLDKHRPKDEFKPQIRLKLNWHHHRLAPFGWHIGFHYSLDQNSGAGAFGLTLSRNVDGGNAYDDYLPGEIDFTAHRLRTFHQQQLSHSQPVNLDSP